VSESLEIELHNRAQAWHDMTRLLFPFIKAVLQGGGRWVLRVERRKRTKAQNRRYWGGGVLTQIANQAVIDGRKFDAEVWHEAFKRQFIGVIDLPNGEVIGKSSTELNTKEFCEFSDRVEAYAATELGVTFYDLQPHAQDIEARKPAPRQTQRARETEPA
jgi:hypothetical protein